MKTCNWQNPGADPYRGPDHKVKQALANYGFPEPVQAELYSKIRRLDPTAVVDISRDNLVATKGTATNLRDMHWGSGPCWGPVLRSGWSEHHVEPALIYCAQDHCVAIPTVCGNIARVDFAFRPPKMSTALEHDGSFRFWDGEIPNTHHSVPEPSTVGLVLAACMILATVKKSRS